MIEMKKQEARDEARQWARELFGLPQDKVLIIDTETCDFNGEVIELAIVDSAGNEIYNRRFNPFSTIQPGAQRAHGITNEMLADEPRFASEYARIQALLASAEIVLIYNAPFDLRCLAETCRLHLVEPLTMKTDCIMRWYAQFYGEWRRGQYKWQPLWGGDHSALGDARAALNVLRVMAGVSESEVVP